MPDWLSSAVSFLDCPHGERPFSDFPGRLEADAGISPGLPCVVVGDFNVKLPASDRNRDHERRLRDAFSEFRIVTEGALSEAGRPLIDHVAISPDLRCATVTT